MLPNLHDRIEQLARMVVLTDAGDLPGLVSLQEQSVVLAGELEGDAASALGELATKISRLAEAIVMRTSKDVDATFKEIGDVVSRMQHAAARGTGNPASARSEAADAAADRELITAWIAGCEGMLSELEGKLLQLERSPADAEVIAEIRRTMHTLKGECGVLSLHAAQKVCHEAETLIDARLEAKLELPIDPFLALLDWLKVYVLRLTEDPAAKPDDHTALLKLIIAAQASAKGASDAAPETPMPDSAAPANTLGDDASHIHFGPQAGTEENLADFLCEAREHLSNSEEALLALDQDSSNVELINTVFRAFHTIKGVSGFMALHPIVSLAHSAEQLLDGARGGALILGRRELDMILASCDMMTQLMRVLEGGTGPTKRDFEAVVRNLDHAAGASGSKSGAPAHATQAQNQTTPAPAATKTANPPVIETKDAVPPSSPVPGREEPASKSRKADQTVKVNTTRMDALVTMVGELVIAQQMVVQDVAKLTGNGQRMQRNLSHMGKMIRDLQEVSMSLRMVNLKGTFQKMTRLVRDVSQKAGKQIEVITSGEDVELDRNVVEAITDPLVHMVRNSCDHGVEGVEERRAAGKPLTGQVTLRAYHAGGSIVIEISDDGRGLRREKLLAKAKSKGIIPADADEKAMSDGEVFSLIFLPGFSTAEKVTDISGRGVGMDVVRRNIEALRGKIEIQSTPGNGTTFLMRLPLTMAIIDGMVVRVGHQRYVLPTLSIQQSFRPNAKDLKTVVGAGEMVRVRGAMLPIYRLNRVLNLHEGEQKLEEALLIVIEADDSRFCLVVDEILGQHQVVIKSLTQLGQPLKGVSGGAILGDGRVALILDVAQVASLARSETNDQLRVTGKYAALSAA